MRLFKPVDQNKENQDNDGANLNMNEQLSKIVSNSRTTTANVDDIEESKQPIGPGMDLITDLMQVQQDIFGPSEESHNGDDLRMDLDVPSNLDLKYDEE